MEKLEKKKTNLDLDNLVNNIPLNESDKKIIITTSFIEQSAIQPHMSLI